VAGGVVVAAEVGVGVGGGDVEEGGDVVVVGGGGDGGLGAFDEARGLGEVVEAGGEDGGELEDGGVVGEAAVEGFGDGEGLGVVAGVGEHGGLLGAVVGDGGGELVGAAIVFGGAEEVVAGEAELGAVDERKRVARAVLDELLKDFVGLGGVHALEAHENGLADGGGAVVGGGLEEVEAGGAGEGFGDVAVLEQEVGEDGKDFGVAGLFGVDGAQLVDGLLAEGFGGRIGEAELAEEDGDELATDEGGGRGVGDAVLEDVDGRGGVGGAVVAAEGGAGLDDPGGGVGGEARGEVAADGAGAVVFLGVEVGGGEPEGGALGVGVRGDEFLGEGEGVLHLAAGGEADADADGKLVAGRVFGEAEAVGLLGLVELAAGLEVDAFGVACEGAGMAVAVVGEGLRKRNKPAVRMGRWVWH